MVPQQNVLFVIIDQFRADLLIGDLAQYVELPNLRALMADAVCFARHYSVANPCGPSRASILTGQYSMNHRSVRNGAPLRHDTPNLATEATSAGYEPMLFGYTDTAQDPRVYPLNDPALTTEEHPMRGFREMLEMRQQESHPWRADLIAKGYNVPEYSEYFIPVAADGQTRRVNDPAFYKAEDSDTAFLTNCWLKEHEARVGKTWFSHLNYLRPHPPLVASAPYNKMYNPADLPLPARLSSAEEEARMHPFIVPAMAHQTAQKSVNGFPDLVEDDASIRAIRAIYLGLASEVDSHIGRVIRFLKETEQYENTLIVVTSDHGEMLGDRYSWGKMTVYDAAFHTPLIIRDPRSPAEFGQVVTEPTESIDVVPTILDWMRHPIPSSMDGAALTPFLQGKTPDAWRDFSYSELDFGDPVTPTIWQQSLNLGPSVANLAILRGSRFTLVHFNGGLAPLLFDFQSEGEFRNLAQDPAWAPVVLEMTQKILNHRMEKADQTLATTKITADGPVIGVR